MNIKTLNDLYSLIKNKPQQFLQILKQDGLLIVTKLQLDPQLQEKLIIHFSTLLAQKTITTQIYQTFYKKIKEIVNLQQNKYSNVLDIQLPQLKQKSPPISPNKNQKLKTSINIKSVKKNSQKNKNSYQLNEYEKILMNIFQNYDQFAQKFQTHRNPKRFLMRQLNNPNDNLVGEVFQNFLKEYKQNKYNKSEYIEFLNNFKNQILPRGKWPQQDVNIQDTQILNNSVLYNNNIVQMKKQEEWNREKVQKIEREIEKQREKESMKKDKPVEMMKQQKKQRDVIVTVAYLKDQCLIDYSIKVGTQVISLKKQIESYVMKLPGTTHYLNVSKPSYEPIKQVVRSDVVGLYTYNPLQNILSIKLRTQKNEDFPKQFKINKILQIKFQEYNFKEWNQKILNQMQWKTQDNLNLDTFVKRILQKNQSFSQQMYSTILKIFKDQNIIKISDLYGRVDNDYNYMRMPRGAAIAIQAEIELVKNNQSSKRQKNKQQKVLNQSQKNGYAHKMIRFFLYQNDIQKLKKFPYLSQKALKHGFNQIKESFKNPQLLQKLKNFYDPFVLSPTLIPEKLQNYPRGMLLFGPPGTGKTQLSEKIPGLIGLQVICQGLSASDFSKSLVGQTQEMIKQLVDRAKLTPYLWCSAAIDQIDGLVPKRDQKAGGSKIDGLAMLLSVIGGIKDVPNLIFIASTNRLNKIDEAFRRRMSGQYQVGRPSPNARRELMMMGRQQSGLVQKQLLQHCVNITANFTGSALVNLRFNLIAKYQKQKKMNYDILTKTASLTAQQFSITLGTYTLPDVFQQNKKKQFLLNQSFLKNVHKSLILISQQKTGETKLQFATPHKKMVFSTQLNQYKQQLIPVLNTEIINQISKDQTDLFVKINQYFRKNNYDEDDSMKFTISYKRKAQFDTIKDFFSHCKHQIGDQAFPTIFLIQSFTFEDRPKGYIPAQYMEFIKTTFTKSYKNLYILFLIPNNIKQSKEYQKNIDEFRQTIKKKLNWQEVDLNYSGRIMIDLSDKNNYGMAFQLENNKKESKIFNKPFLKSGNTKKVTDVLPHLIDFSTKNDLDLVLLLDQNLLMVNSAFDQSKIKETLEQKIQQARNCNKFLIIIDVCSLVSVNKSISDSSMGQSTSYNISDTKIYTIVLNYIKSYPKYINQDQQQWVAFIVDNKMMARYLKEDLNWPSNPSQIIQKKQQQEESKEVVCLRCGEYYKQIENKTERKCIKHPGLIADNNLGEHTPYDSQKAKKQYVKQQAKYKNKKQNDNVTKQPYFVYLCCWGDFSTPGCKKYYHTNDRESYEIQKNTQNSKSLKRVEQLIRMRR